MPAFEGGLLGNFLDRVLAILTYCYDSDGCGNGRVEVKYGVERQDGVITGSDNSITCRGAEKKMGP